MKTFPMGGVHPSENKLSGAKPIEVLPLPDVVTIPLAQHIGAPAVAKVAKGDKVVTGQLIAEAGSFMSANIHAPVSGTVTAVDMVPNGQGLRQMMITIKREGDDWAEGIDRSETIVRECTLSAQEIVARIKDAGIVGMGGATFPTHVKLSIPPGKKAESLIINGVECEPYLTSDHRTMLEHGEELLVGVTILMKAIAVEKAYIGIENNKPDAIAHLRKLAEWYKGIEVVPLKVKYPQGGEKQLIAAVTGLLACACGGTEAERLHRAAMREYLDPIRPGYEGRNPFWNAFATKFIYAYFNLERRKDFYKKFQQALDKYFPGLDKKAVHEAIDAAYDEYARHMQQLRDKGTEIIAAARKEGKHIVVLAGRPYHVDPEVNHGINQLIIRQGAAVVSEDSVSWHEQKFQTAVLNQWTYHSRLYAAAKYCTTQKDMDLVQLVSFGCGVDAITTDETREILQEGGKLYTQLKIDEITNLGAVNIRLRSLFAALDERDEVAAEKAE